MRKCISESAVAATGAVAGLQPPVLGKHCGAKGSVAVGTYPLGGNYCTAKVDCAVK